MDLKSAPSKTKASSPSIRIRPTDPLAGSSSSSTGTKPEFTNHGQSIVFLLLLVVGLILWTHTRQLWVTSKQSNQRSTQTEEPRLSWDATYDSLLGSNKPFPQAIPLPEMVDFLVDVWEQEGLYD